MTDVPSAEQPMTQSRWIQEHRLLTCRIVVPQEREDVQTSDAQFMHAAHEAAKKLHVRAADAGMWFAEYSTLEEIRYWVPSAGKSGGEWRIRKDCKDLDIEDLRMQVVLHLRAECVMAPELAVLADGPRQAVEYAQERWPYNGGSRVLAITDKISLARLHGHRYVPFTIAPGTQRLMWHRDTAHHERAGRIAITSDTQYIPAVGGGGN